MVPAREGACGGEAAQDADDDEQRRTQRGMSDGERATRPACARVGRVLVGALTRPLEPCGPLLQRGGGVGLVEPVVEVIVPRVAIGHRGEAIASLSKDLGHFFFRQVTIVVRVQFLKQLAGSLRIAASSVPR